MIIMTGWFSKQCTPKQSHAERYTHTNLMMKTTITQVHTGFRRYVHCAIRIKRARGRRALASQLALAGNVATRGHRVRRHRRHRRLFILTHRKAYGRIAQPSLGYATVQKSISALFKTAFVGPADRLFWALVAVCRTVLDTRHDGAAPATVVGSRQGCKNSM
jgi:hypothetical protein